jgi:hypothetical protein
MVQLQHPVAAYHNDCCLQVAVGALVNPAPMNDSFGVFCVVPSMLAPQSSQHTVSLRTRLTCFCCLLYPCCCRFPDMFDPAGFAAGAKVRDIRR